MSQTLTTELEAVNYMLRTAGERPVAALGSDTPVTKASIARDILRDESRSFQEKGWSFNSETEYPLTPLSTTKEIILPANVLRCDPVDRTLDYVQRGSKLYNRVNHTYRFDGAVSVDIVWFLPWEELPEAARKYVKVKAARVFQKQSIGDPQQVSITEEEETRAWVDFLDSEAEVNEPNFLVNIPALNRYANPPR